MELNICAGFGGVWVDRTLVTGTWIPGRNVEGDIIIIA